MTYIQTINEAEATGELAELYARYRGPDGRVDSVLKAHALNPASLGAHMALYLQAMRAPGPVSKSEREMVGVVTSAINGCAYCVAHHSRGLRAALDPERAHGADDLIDGLVRLEYRGLNPRETAMVRYAEVLARTPSAVTPGHIDALHGAGLSDRDILDVCQVAAYFAYANRMVLGLGVELETG